MKTLRIIAIVLAAAATAAAQPAISAKSGLVNYLQGSATLDGSAVQVKATRFVTVAKNSVFRTGEGLAEVLLGPGAVLRMGENSAFKMLSNDLTDTRVELLEGSVIVEMAEASKDSSIAVVYSDASIGLTKNGVYRVDFSPARLLVYDGEAKVRRDGQTQSVKKSKRLALEGVAVAEKFDTKSGDSLYLWARRRAEYLAVANVSAARSMGQLGFSSTSARGWVFNPYFGAYTYLPMSGVYDSFWGYRYWSTGAVYDYLYDRRYRDWSGSSGRETSGGTTTSNSVPLTSNGKSGVAAIVSSSPANSGAGAGAGAGRISAPGPVPTSGARR